MQSFGMKKVAALVLFLWPLSLPAGDPAESGARKVTRLREGRYKILEGSYAVIDDGQPVPPIEVPVKGRFWVVTRRGFPWLTVYGIKGVVTTVDGRAVRVDGEYRRYMPITTAEQAPAPPWPTAEMWLLVRRPANVPGIPEQPSEVLLHGGPVPVGNDLPWIIMKLKQVTPKPGPGIPSIALNLIAAPWPIVQFSTEVPFTPEATPGDPLSDGDLLDTFGQVVRTNHQLTSRLGIMPAVPDLGLDAVMAAPSPVEAASDRPVYLFSLEKRIFSETLGWLGEGDLLSEKGAIVATNAELLRNFPAPPIPFDDLVPVLLDYGLDAVCAAPCKSLYFSIEKNYGLKIRHGDLLSTEGEVVKTNAELLEHFRLATVGVSDFGLDALYVLPGGEVWFSTETDFEDRLLGVVRHGDLLSDRGWIVARNKQLMAPFGPLEELVDFGLDALNICDGKVVTAYGHLTRELEGCLLLKTTTGKYYLLENYGRFAEGDSVWVRGYLDTSCVSVCQVPCLRDNAIEAAMIAVCGTIRAFGRCMLFNPEGMWQLYVLDNYGDFGPGDRVKVTGIVSDFCAMPPECEGPIPISYAGCIEANEIAPCGGCEPRDPHGLFVRGDADGDGSLTLGDAIRILLYCFGFPGREPCRSQGGERCCCYDIYDVNDSGDIDLGDVIYLIRYLFVGGMQPADPFPECGEDPTADSLRCEGMFCTAPQPTEQR